MPLLLDTGVLYALADADDAWHQRARAHLEENRDLLLVPVTVLPEVSYLLHLRLGPRAEQAFVRSLVQGELAIQPLTEADLKRSLALIERYPDIGFVDATVVAIAERLKLKAIATTDRRHFAKIRPKHVQAFRLLP